MFASKVYRGHYSLCYIICWILGIILTLLSQLLCSGLKKYLAKQGFNGVGIWGSDDLLDEPIVSAISENGSNFLSMKKNEKN